MSNKLRLTEATTKGIFGGEESYLKLSSVLHCKCSEKYDHDDVCIVDDHATMIIIPGNVDLDESEEAF